MNEIKLLLSAQTMTLKNVYNIKSAKQNKLKQEDALHWLSHLSSLQAVNSKEVLSYDMEGT